MGKVEVADPFENLTEGQIKEYINKRTTFDPTEIRDKDPNRHYRLVRKTDSNIKKYQEMGYVLLSRQNSKGEKLVGATDSQPFEVGDTVVMFTDIRIKKAVDEAKLKKNKEMLGAHRREFLREVREAEQEAGVTDDRRMEVLEEKPGGRFVQIQED